MTSTKFSPLHLEAPRLVADVALGEHLAALARASTPSAASRVRRSGWRVPLAAIVTIAASSSVAYAGQAALHSGMTQAGPSVAPTSDAMSAAALGAARATAAAALASIDHVMTNPHGKVVGRGHPKTGKAWGHPGRHDAGEHEDHDAIRVAPPVPRYHVMMPRKSDGSAGGGRP